MQTHSLLFRLYADKWQLHFICHEDQNKISTSIKRGGTLILLRQMINIIQDACLIIHKYLAKRTLTNGWIQRERSSTDTPPHYNIASPRLFIHPPSTHQLNLFPLARSGTILAPYLLSLSLNEFLFNLQEDWTVDGLLIWCLRQLLLSPGTQRGVGEKTCTHQQTLACPTGQSVLTLWKGFTLFFASYLAFLHVFALNAIFTPKCSCICVF